MAVVVADASIVNTATGEVVDRCVVEVEDGVILTWGGVLPPPFDSGFEFDLDPEAQRGRWRQPDGSYGPPPAPPDTRTDAQKVADAIAEMDALTTARMLTCGFVYDGMTFSSSQTSQSNWAVRFTAALAVPGPVSVYVNNIDDTDGMTFTHTDQLIAAALSGLQQVGVFREYTARLKNMLRANGASWIPTYQGLVQEALAKTGQQLLSELG